MWTLTAIAVATGLLLLWIWKRFSRPQSIAQAKRQMRARLYAIRLYGDDPVLILRAQGYLLAWIARYLAQALRPAAIALIPLLALFVELDAVYGHRPLAPAESAVVTARFPAGAGLQTLDPVLLGRGVTVETPAVRIPARHEACWRVRAVSVQPAVVVLRLGGRALASQIDCGRLRLSLMPPWTRPTIELQCPAAAFDVFGVSIDWRLWYPLVIVITMLMFRRRFGVVF